MWNGVDRHNHKYYVSTKEAADEWKKNNNYDAIYEKEIIVHDSYIEIMSFRNSEAKKAALAKLSEEDKIALGL